MKDRISSKPGRVLVTPENGTPAFYAKLTMADEPTQSGDAPTKKNLLTDETASLLDLSESATVNDFLRELYGFCSYKTLADITVPENGTALLVELAENFTKYRNVEIIISTANERGFNYTIWAGQTAEGRLLNKRNNTSKNLFTRTSLFVSPAQGGFVALPNEQAYISNSYTGLVFDKDNADYIYILSDEEWGFVANDRVLVVAR
jgi:hypothetical protein